jgi:hypothetical protein
MFNKTIKSSFFRLISSGENAVGMSYLVRVFLFGFFINAIFISSLFSQTYGRSGPAGVGSLLNIAWPDASGNGFSASQSNPSYQPIYLSAGLNGNPAVQFDGALSYLQDAHSYDARTAFIVYSVNSGLQNSGQLGQVWGNYSQGVHVAMDPRTGINVNGFSFDGTPIDMV